MKENTEKIRERVLSLIDSEFESDAAFERELSDYLVATKGDLLASIRETGNLSDENAAELREAIETCKAKFLA